MIAGSRRARASVGLLVAALALGGGSPLRAQAVITIDDVAASGFSRPVYATHADDGSGRLFVVEQDGRIRIVDGGVVLATPFLDIDPLVASVGEQGLLGIAFHPQYASNGFFYVNYTDNAGDTAIARYSVSDDANVADPSSALVLLAVAQPASNHNAGQLQFGPLDGYLYVGMGDGGGGDDPFGHEQNKETLLGTILRLDVDGASPYAIPPDNPFVGAAGADEIWAYGLRNPWRFSFDRDNGDLYVGDVGQGAWEEISFQAAGTPGGLNFGWVVREGPCPTGELLPCAAAPAGFTDPIAFYGRSDGRSVTGGFVYRGALHPDLAGRYFFGDFITGRIWSIEQTGAAPITWSSPIEEIDAPFNVSSFGEDEAGELYVIDYFGGTIRAIGSLDPPVITSPVPGAALSGSSELFRWEARATPVTEWWVYAGGEPGSAAFYESGSLGASTETTVMGLPTAGRAI